MNIVGAVIAGIVGTLVISMVMAMGPKMGMPKMDIVGMLGSMFSREPNRLLGWLMHLVMGIVFALIYVFLWSIGIGAATVVWAILFGIVHWLIAGLMMGMMPMMHTGMQAGTINEPGVLMLNSGGILAFMGGLMGHIIYAIVVVVIYGFFI